MRKYFVEIQDKKDFDYLIMQSQWFESEFDARQWFNSLEWFDSEKLTATIMTADVDKISNEPDGDIELYDWLSGGEKGW